MFGDLHVYAHLSRIQFEDIAIDFLHYVLNYCKKNKIEHVWFLGDWFHVKNKLYVPPFIKSIEALKYFKQAGINITFLIGNHDAPQQDSTDFSVMYAFEPYGKVIPLYEWQDIGDTRIHYLSYTHELPQFEYKQDGNNVLLGHLDVEKFVMESGMECHDGFKISDFKKFDQVFTGHFHKHQIRENVVYVGSPYQTRYSERFDEKGFAVFDTDTLDWKFEIYSEAPKFKEIDLDNYDSGNIQGNFVRIKTHKDNDNLEEIKNKLLSLGAETVDFIFENSNEEKELNMIEDLTMGDMQDLASQWFDTVEESGLFSKSIEIMLEKKKLKKKDFMNVFKEIKEAHLSGWQPPNE